MVNKPKPFYVDEQGFNLPFAVKESDGTAFVLTGYTIKFWMWLPNAATSKISNGTVVPDDEDAGTCHYVVQATDFNTAGSYNWELVLTSDSIERKARGEYNIVIEEEHPPAPSP